MAEPTRAEIDQYKVLLLNDDHTPMEFVVEVLERFFDKDREEATRVMLQVHLQGRRHLWRLYPRSRRGQSRRSHGIFKQTQTSSEMHDRKAISSARSSKGLFPF